MKKAIDRKRLFYLWLLIGRTRDAVHKVRNIELSQYNITSQQAGVLVTIVNKGGQAKATEIGRSLFRERHSAHGILQRMEKIGFIEQIKDNTRKNGISVRLTNKGLEVYKQTLNRQFIDKIFSPLTNEQIESMISSLEILRKNALNEIGVEDNWALE